MTDETAELPSRPPAEQTASAEMVESYLRNDMDGAQDALDCATAELGEDDGSTNEPTQLRRMPDAPKMEAPEVDRAIAKLNNLGGDHAQLVNEWGGDFSENLAYAKAAFTDIAKSRPDLIEKFDAAGLGNDPAILKHLAQHGRLHAGLMGDMTVARNYSYEPTTSRISSARPGSKRAAQDELNELYRENPPGTEKYKDPKVQRRITQLTSMISGNDEIVGMNGRTA